MKNRPILKALTVSAIISFCLISFIGCIPKELETSEKGKTGLPTSVYDRGIQPPTWKVEQSTLPLYPGAPQYNNWRNFISEDDFDDVVGYYESQLKDAETIRSEDGEEPMVTFKTFAFNLAIEMDEDRNTLITFSAPDGYEG